ncbi:PREDICTED: adhesion G-protein coupled receptor G7-like [Branchiostoma belcheri]|uniref:Adhesion G-protein coupled receptor G7-like n=1 Tax=Branchiostoma belcheri TaxID=7741 RepID=A0A6P4YR69_BRABE|nr:PREDICTED: adhesion G-protein coupled receptor G7-like [Branchiostoma belcheri]
MADGVACLRAEKAVRFAPAFGPIVVNNETALSVATELQLITTQAETLSSGDVSTITDTLQKIVNASATEQIGDSLLTTVDNLIKVNVTVLQQSQEEMRGPTRAVQALETFADTVILTTDTYTAVRPGVALQAADISPEELDKGQGFAFFLSGSDSDSLTEGDVTSFTTEVGGDILQTADISISLPPNISSMILQIKNLSEVRLSYTLYNSSSLFVQLSQGAVGPSQSATVPSQGAVGTRIIGGRIAGRRVKDLPEPVITTFVPLQETFVPEDMRKVKCVFWDFDADAWSTEGCESMGEKMGRYTCACNHLTNFAIIFDVSGEGFGDHEKPLEVITIVGCVVSIVCLVLTLFSFIVTRRDKRRTRTGHAKNQRLVLINLCVALLATLVIFLAGINRTASPIGCKAVAALLHYFLLAALMWMAVEAVNLYRAVVQVFDNASENFVIKTGAVAWGFPLVATLSTAGPSSLYKYRMEKACWLAREPLIYAFLIPAGLILLFNLLVFILVMYKLVREEKKQRELRGADAIKVDRQWIILQIRRACSIMALFGLTWVFGFFVIDDARTVFAYLFCISNTLQGLIIFIFHCVMREDMTKWRKKLTCWKKFIYIGQKKQGQYQVNGSKSFSSASQAPQTILIGLSTLSLDTKPNPKSL